MPVCGKESSQSLSNSIHDSGLLVAGLTEKEIPLKIIKAGQLVLEGLHNEDADTDISEICSGRVALQKKYSFPEIGENLSCIKGGSLFYADTDGVFFIDQGIPRLLPLNYDGNVRINILDEEMTVTLDLFPSMGEGNKLLFKSVFDQLKDRGISVDIKTDLIAETIDNIESSKQVVRGLKVAEGVVPLDGFDGSVEFFVETDIDLKPQVTADGRIDFHNMNLNNSVKKDQKLAVYCPHVLGRDGRNVFGNLIPGRKARIVQFPAGKNTYTDPKNPNIVRAAIDGSIVKHDGKIAVSKVFNINGNVDYSTGNINNEGSLRILGDIKSGFEVRSSESIEVRGVIEDAKIHAGGDLLVTSGFTGSGQGKIEAGGNVDIRYVRNQEVFSRGSISISHEVIDSKLYAANRIQVVGNMNVSVMGGHIISRDFIEMNCVGNEYGVQTIIEAGFDYELENTLKKLRGEAEQLEQTIENIRKGMEACYRKLQLNVNERNTLKILVDQKILLYEKPEDQDFKECLNKLNLGIEKICKNARMGNDQCHSFRTLIDQKITSKRTLARKRDEIFKIEKEIYAPTKAKIQISRQVYPGTIILINKRKFFVKEPMMNKVFHLSHDGKFLKFS